MKNALNNLSVLKMKKIIRYTRRKIALDQIVGIIIKIIYDRNYILLTIG